MRRHGHKTLGSSLSDLRNQPQDIELDEKILGESGWADLIADHFKLQVHGSCLHHHLSCTLQVVQVVKCLRCTEAAQSGIFCHRVSIDPSDAGCILSGTLREPLEACFSAVQALCSYKRGWSLLPESIGSTWTLASANMTPRADLYWFLRDSMELPHIMITK